MRLNPIIHATSKNEFKQESKDLMMKSFVLSHLDIHAIDKYDETPLIIQRIEDINGVREAIEYIKKGFSIALMIDQRVSEGEKIDLFNKAALTTTLPAQLAIKYNLQIIPVFIERINENNFRIEFYNSITASNFNNKKDLTKKLNETLEKMISKNPGQWIWTHNRWK